MGKAAMCIRMLQILNTGRVYKVSELASMLDTNPRNIIEYKKELDNLCIDGGVYIDNISGRYGGYRLNGNAVIPALKLQQKEKDALIEAYNYSLSKKDFVKKEEMISAFAKVLSNLEIEEKEKKLLVVDKYQLAMNEEDIKERYEFIEKAIETKHVIEIEYASLKNGLKTNVVHPYKLFIYNNSWFFLAWTPEAGEVYYYKVNRIKKYKMLDKKFTVWKGFDPQKYFDNQGLKQNGEYHHVVIIAKGTRAMLFKERVYGKNQIIEDLEDGKIKVSLDMQNDNTMVNFVLGCGAEAEVLEPQWLVDKVKESLHELTKIYG